METSDDAIFRFLNKTSVVGDLPFGLGQKADKDRSATASATADKPTKTATALEQESEQKKLNKRRKASLLTRDFGTAQVSRPTLGQTGLLGLN